MSKNILIVDDVADNLKILSEQLMSKGYTVRPVTSGELALKTIETALPDIILLDIKMPNMDGYEVCRRLKANEKTKDIPIIFISALDEVTDKIKAFGSGGVDYITKPFQSLEVLARVRTHLELYDVKKSLEDMNANLEKKVMERTEELKQRNYILETMNTIGIELALLSSDENIHEFAVKKLKDITGAVAVTFNDYDPDSKEIVVNHIEINKGIIEKVIRLLGKGLKEIRSPVSDEVYQEIVSNIIGKRQTLTEVTFGAIPPLASASIQKLMRVDFFIGIAYVIEGELYGTSMLAIESGMPEPPSELLESFAHMMAVSLRRRQVEDELKKSGEQYRILVDNLPDVIIRFDQAGRFLYVSNSMPRESGMTPDNLIGKTHRELGFPENVYEFWEKYIFMVFDTGKSYEEEVEVQVINNFVTYNLRFLPETDEIGNVKTVLSIARDITEHRISERKYKDLFHSMINGFALHEIICDESGVPIDYRFLEVNPAFETLTGLNKNNVIGRTIKEILPNIEDYWIEKYGRIALTGSAENFENYNKDLDKYFETNAYSNQKGQFATVFNDITERVKSQDIQAKLQQVSKMESIGRLAGGIAHDFNNLLTVIQGSATMAMMGLNRNDPLLEKLKMVEEASDRAEELTNQLLAFSRKQIIEPKIVNLNDIIVNLRKMLIRLLGEDIELMTFLSENLVNVNADVSQIEQVIINLAVNSRDAMPNGGKLTIETMNIYLDEDYCIEHLDSHVGDHVMISISDNGNGMSEEVMKQIFEPFFTTKKAEEGTGLGLATVYGIVKQHNGSIECYSELSNGTTFKIYIPKIISDDEAIELSEEEYKDKIFTGEETILLAEDEGIVRSITSSFLKKLGYNVLVAENGGTALIIAEQYDKTIHLLMTDIVMPKINGRELAERLLKIYPEMKVLYTSGYTQNVIAHHGILDKGTNFISKPYKLQTLGKKLRDILDGDSD
jgi:two-component system cell cycle sensor histidine kinase/response regulator CckA